MTSRKTQECEHDWRDIDGRWLCIECRSEKPYTTETQFASCPTCGSKVIVHTSDEGTSFYEPVTGLTKAEERYGICTVCGCDNLNCVCELS